MNFKKAALTIALVSSVIGMNANAAQGTAEVTLQGLITTTSCDVTANQGLAVLDVGIFKSSDFEANTQLGEMPLVVSLDCTDAEEGDLIITGITSKDRVENDIFTSSVDNTVGFMIKDASDSVVENFKGPQVSTEAGIVTDYIFTVGMASSQEAPEAGLYSAPINVTYVTK
ncbi:TPA: fimbrial protein [Vibrio metschnikovii]